MTRHVVRPIPRRQGGQTLVEFALIFPLFIVMLFGILDLGRITFAYNTVAHAARQASRVAMTRPVPTTIQQAAVTAAQGLDPARLTVTVTFPDGTTVSGSRVQVTVTYRFDAATPIIRPFVGSNGLQLQASSTIYVE